MYEWVGNAEEQGKAYEGASLQAWPQLSTREPLEQVGMIISHVVKAERTFNPVHLVVYCAKDR